MTQFAVTKLATCKTLLTQPDFPTHTIDKDKELTHKNLHIFLETTTRIETAITRLLKLTRLLSACMMDVSFLVLFQVLIYSIILMLIILIDDCVSLYLSL